MMKVCNREDSFTLVEILIVLAIVTIVGVATVPRISTALDTVRFRGTVSGLVTFLRNAHLEAILKRKETVVTINFKENTLKIDDDKQFTLPSQMTLEPEKEDSHESMKYRFFYNGRGSGPRIHVIGKNKRKAVVFVDLLSGLSGFDLR
ncbi:MAG: prepilin-type N-terminal cleavage/methylation domain-containing protein [Candidatus Scalindua sp.]|nr:prepilin-type N-terminal cleavage/methylation domain-containing protein [Candidatus Scalindua sp.]